MKESQNHAVGEWRSMVEEDRDDSRGPDSHAHVL